MFDTKQSFEELVKRKKRLSKETTKNGLGIVAGLLVIGAGADIVLKNAVEFGSGRKALEFAQMYINHSQYKG